MNRMLIHQLCAYGQERCKSFTEEEIKQVAESYNTTPEEVISEAMAVASDIQSQWNRLNNPADTELPVITEPGTEPVITEPGTEPVITEPGTEPVITEPGTEPVNPEGTGGN